MTLISSVDQIRFVITIIMIIITVEYTKNCTYHMTDKFIEIDE